MTFTTNPSVTEAVRRAARRIASRIWGRMQPDDERISGFTVEEIEQDITAELAPFPSYVVNCKSCGAVVDLFPRVAQSAPADICAEMAREAEPMTEKMPERIWIVPPGGPWASTRGSDTDIEYLRSDLALQSAPRTCPECSKSIVDNGGYCSECNEFTMASTLHIRSVNKEIERAVEIVRRIVTKHMDDCTNSVRAQKLANEIIAELEGKEQA